MYLMLLRFAPELLLGRMSRPRVTVKEIAGLCIGFLCLYVSFLAEGFCTYAGYLNQVLVGF